ncbi:MAG: DUF2892 domain-containing protein [Bacteroidales bacterium]
MKKEDIIRLVAGTFITTGTLLAYFVSVNWLLLPLFVGLNLFQSSITKFCPLEYFLEKMGVK